MKSRMVSSIKCQLFFFGMLMVFAWLQLAPSWLVLPMVSLSGAPLPARHRHHPAGVTTVGTMSTGLRNPPGNETLLGSGAQALETLPGDNSHGLGLSLHRELLTSSRGPSDILRQVPPTFHRKWKVDCSEIFQGNETEIQRAVRLLARERISSAPRMSDVWVYKPLIPPDADVRNWTRDCNIFTATRDYPRHSRSDEEAAFPVAYIIVVHEKSAQLERLLRAIYQPQNIYCIHPDSKSSEDFKGAVEGLASCFENVFVPSKIEEVQYAGFTRLLADINCMKDLMGPRAIRYPWKYVINLCGQDFPLKSTLLIVRKLKSLGGHNDIAVEEPPSYKQKWTRYHHVVRGGQVTRTSELKRAAPHNMTVRAGLAYYIASRQFVHFVVNNQTAKDLLEWTSDTYSPDETYWVTLQGTAGTPGGRWNPPDGHAVRFIRWRGRSVLPKCRGYFIRSVCVFSMGYLQHLVKRKHLFANKFDYAFDPIALQCLEERVENMNRHPNVYQL